MRSFVFQVLVSQLDMPRRMAARPQAACHLAGAAAKKSSRCWRHSAEIHDRGCLAAHGRNSCQSGSGPARDHRRQICRRHQSVRPGRHDLHGLRAPETCSVVPFTHMVSHLSPRDASHGISEIVARRWQSSLVGERSSTSDRWMSISADCPACQVAVQATTS